MQEWRRRSKPQISIATGRGTSVQAMAVVEDFIYLNCNSSPTIIQVTTTSKLLQVYTIESFRIRLWH